MTGIGEAIIALASAFLPRDRRARFSSEWRAEFHSIVVDEGIVDGIRFAAAIVRGAPRTGSALRHGDDLPFVEASFAGAAFAVPSVFYVVHGIVTDQYVISVLHIAILIGLFLAVGGLGGNESGLFCSTPSRIGLFVTFVSATALTGINRFVDEVMNPALEGPFRVLPGSMLAQLGMVVLLTAGWFGGRRAQILRVGLTISVTGLCIWLVLSFLNLVLVEQWVDRVYHFITIPSLLALIYACWSASQRYLPAQTSP